MKGIIYQATFGEKTCKVDLGSVSGAGGIWHLYVDNFFQAQFSKSKDGKWQAHFHRPPGWVTGADIEVLCDLIEQVDRSPDNSYMKDQVFTNQQQ